MGRPETDLNYGTLPLMRLIYTKDGSIREQKQEFPCYCVREEKVVCSRVGSAALHCMTITNMISLIDLPYLLARAAIRFGY